MTSDVIIIYQIFLKPPPSRIPALAHWYGFRQKQAMSRSRPTEWTYKYEYVVNFCVDTSINVLGEWRYNNFH